MPTDALFVLGIAVLLALVMLMLWLWWQGQKHPVIEHRDTACLTCDSPLWDAEVHPVDEDLEMFPQGAYSAVVAEYCVEHCPGNCRVSHEAEV